MNYLKCKGVELFYLKLIIFLAAMVSAAPASAVTMNDLAKLSAEFEKTLAIDVDKRILRNIVAVEYGNNSVGYFKSKKWSKKKGSLSVNLIPPSYRVPTTVFAVLKNGQRAKIFSDSFISPLPEIFSKVKIDVEKKGLASPFYLLNGALPRRALFNKNFATNSADFYKKNANRFTFLMIINRIGEIVWAHVPVIDGALFSSYMSAKKIGNGYYGIMFGKHSGYFEVAKYTGEILRDFSSRDALVPFAMHHDFEMIGNNKLYAVGNKIEDLYKYTKKSADKGKTFLTDTLIGIDLKKGKAKELRHFSNEFNPDITPYFTGDAPGDKKFAVWGKPKVDVDFLHINGVDHVKNHGVLVSFRNISKVGLLDNKFQEMKWTLGSEKSDTFYIENPKDRFLQQHTPVLLSKDSLVLFDNAAKTRRSRAIRYKLDREKGKAYKDWEFKPEQKFYSKDRSSVYVLPNGHYGVYFVNPKVNGSLTSIVPHRDYYYEVDSKTGEELARVRITFGAATPGYRMIPISEISRDEFIGERLQINVSELKRPRNRR